MIAIRYIAVLFFLLSMGCQKGSITYRQEINPEGWHWDDPAEYDIQNFDTGGAIEVLLEYATDYDYENIYLLVDHKSPLQRKDTISYQLIDKTGQWKGTCHDDRCTARFPLLTNSDRIDNNTIELKIYQHSRDTLLTGIYSISLIEKREKSTGVLER